MNPNNPDPNNPNPPVNPNPTPVSSNPGSAFPPSDLSSVLNNTSQPNPTNPFDTQPSASMPTTPPDPNLQNPFTQSAASGQNPFMAPPPIDTTPQQTWNPTPINPEPQSPIAPAWPPAPAENPTPTPMPTFTPPQVPENSLPVSDPMPTYTPPISQTPTMQANSQDFMANMPMSGQTMANPNVETVQSQPNIQSEPAPTDLSHLIPTQNGNETPVYTPPITQPDTLVVPPNGNTSAAPNLSTEGKTTIPKWMIGLAVGLLLVVSAASAYFILGIGQPQTSAPAAQQIQQTPVTAPPAVITSAPPAASASATGAGFGQFQNPTPSSTATGSSAADILRQRLRQ